MGASSRLFLYLPLLNISLCSGFGFFFFCTYHNLPTSHLKFFVNIFKAVIDPFRYPAHSYLFDIWAISVFLFLQLMPC